jgi:hypothetical protein
VSPTKQDDETAKEAMTPDFLKGIDISPEEEQEMENAAYSGAADDIAKRGGLSGTDLKAAEESPTSPTATTKADPKEGYKAGFGYRDEDSGPGKKGKKKATGSFLNRNKKWFIGGGVGSGITGLILSFMLILPLKVQHVANNLQSHFFASSESATQGMTDKLFTQYLIKKVVPSMAGTKACTTTRASSSCVSVTPGDGPIARLYNAWREKNFEGKLAENQGLEIRKEGNKFYLKSNRLSADVELGNYDPKNPKAFEKTAFASMDRTEVRREVRRSFENESFAKRVKYKYLVDGLLKKKYSIKPCLVACETRDKLADRADAKEQRKELRKLKFKAYFIDRIVTPRNEMLALAMKCAEGGFECTKAGPADEDGERTSDFERETRARIGELNASGDIDSKEKIASLEEDAANIRENGLTGHILERMVGETGAKAVTAAIPVVDVLQLIDTAARVSHGINEAGPGLKKLNYMINSQTDVTTYMMYRTNADEIKTGEADAADVGIVADSLGPDNGTDQGGAGAEEAPIYQDIMGSGGSKTASIFSAFSPRATAASGYKCNDGSTIASGVCPEMLLNSTRFVVDAAGIVSDISRNMPTKFVADAWLNTGGVVFDKVYSLGGKLFEGLGNLAQLIPGYNFIVDHASEIFSAVGKWFIGKAINDVVGNSPSGGRMFEMAAAGADVSGSTYAHYGLGGQRISDAAAAEIRTAMAAQEKDDFMHESSFARMFDTSSQYSVISKVALAMPSTTASGTMRSFASSLLNPFASVTTQFGGSKKTSAASDKDPYGVTQYGYSPNDPVLQTDDLQTYWDQHDCSNPDKAKQWGDAEVHNVNPDTDMPENDVTNGCQLILASVQMSGAMFDDSLLPADTLGSNSISDPTATTDDTTTTLPDACYTVTKLTGKKIEGRMFHKEDNLPINTYAKENSPQGIRYAANNNYDSIDLDIQITKDGVPVNTHWGQPMAKDGFYDPLGKLKPGTQVSDMTLEEVTRLRNHDGQSQIYSLEDQIKVLANNNVNLSLELKTGALVKTFPQITTWLNQAGVKAYIKGDASKPSLDKALTAARNFGYWTRGTLGSQDWKAPGPNCVQ